MNNWILICNSSYFDIKKALDTLPEITWPQVDGCVVGDIVYMYATDPYKAILYKCIVEQLDLQYMDSEVVNYVSSPIFYKGSRGYMRLKKIQYFPEKLLTDSELRNAGVVNLQSTSKLSKNTVDYIAQKSGAVEKYNVELTVSEAQNGCNKNMVLRNGKQINVTYPAGLKKGQTVRLKMEDKIILINVSILDDVSVEKTTSIHTNNSKLVKGVIGAILGGLLSSSIWILLYRIGIIAGIAGFVSAVLVFKGYEFLGKTLDKKGLVASIIILIITIYCSVLLGITISVLTSENYPLTISNILYAFLALNVLVFERGEHVSAILKDLILAYVFSAIGCFGFVKRVIKNKTVSE